MDISVKKRIAPYWYTPEGQELDPPARFYLRPINELQRLEISGEFKVASSGDVILTGLGVELALSYGVKDWENVPGPDGEPAPFTRENLHNLDSEVLADLARRVINAATMEEEIEKK